MIWIKLLAPIVVLAIGLIPIAFQEKWRQWHDRRRNVHKFVMALHIGLMCVLTLVTCAIVWHDDRESSSLKTDISKLRQAEIEHQRYVNETAKVVAKRARYVVSHIDGFLMEFAAKWGGPDLQWLCSQDSFARTCDSHNDKETLDALCAAFRRCKMLEPANMMDAETGKPLTMLDVFWRQLFLAHNEAEPILQTYGGISDPIIFALDDVRSRGNELSRLLQTWSKVPGAEQIWKDGVDEQWANYFAHVCLADIRLKRMCFQKLKMHGYHSAKTEN
jgi:hypothetical protein